MVSFLLLVLTGFFWILRFSLFCQYIFSTSCISFKLIILNVFISIVRIFLECFLSVKSCFYSTRHHGTPHRIIYPNFTLYWYIFISKGKASFYSRRFVYLNLYIFSQSTIACNFQVDKAQDLFGYCSFCFPFSSIRLF